MCAQMMVRKDPQPDYNNLIKGRESEWKFCFFEQNNFTETGNTGATRILVTCNSRFCHLGSK